MGWTDANITGQRDRTVVITGATSGLGLETAKALARAGATVVLTGRNPQKLADSTDQVAVDATGPPPRSVRLDLASLASVREAAAELRESFAPISVLINNAGIMAPPRSSTEDGFELQIGTNHLGHFALTGLLLPAMPTSDVAADCRVVTVSSGAHRMGRLDPDDLFFERRRYSAWGAYGQSKLANLLFTAELDRRAAAAGLHLRAVAAHPGYAATNLQFAGPAVAANPFGRIVTKGMNAVLGQPADHGAWPTEFAATDPTVMGGDYIGPGGFAETRGHPKRVGRSAAAADADLARRLWERSESLTGVAFP